MIYKVIKTLTKSGINDITIVLGGESVGDFIRLLGDGSEFNADFKYYKYNVEVEKGLVKVVIEIAEDGTWIRYGYSFDGMLNKAASIFHLFLHEIVILFSKKYNLRFYSQPVN